MSVPREVVANFIRKEFPESAASYREGDKSFRINSVFVEDHKRHLYIFVENGDFRCFKSGERGDFVWLVKKVKKVKGFRNEVERFILNNYYSIKEDDLVKKVKSLESQKRSKGAKLNAIELPEGTFPLNRETPINKKFFIYLDGRGITREMIRKFRMGYCVSGNYSNRIIIPVYDNRKIVYFMSRDITGKSKRKYLNPSREEVKGNGTGAIVFNIDSVKAGDTVVITEGVFNAFHKTEDNVVLCSIFGKSVLFNQLRKILAKKPSALVVAYDNDKFFMKSTLESYNFIKREIGESKSPEIKIVNWSKYKEGTGDFGDLYKDVDSLPIHCVSYQQFLSKNFI